MKYGLDDSQINKINKIFTEFPQIEKATIYGSRAKGTHRNNSDIDLTLTGISLNYSTLINIEQKLDDLLLPFNIDLTIIHNIDNENLLHHIERYGVVFYEKR